MAGIPLKRKRYNLLSDNQKSILRRYFENGMTGTKKSFSKQIQEASDEAAMTVDEVKQWIGNERQRRRKQACEGSDRDEPPSASHTIKIPAFIKGATSYNRFAADVFKTVECRDLPSLKEKNRLVAEKWHQLSAEQKNSFKKPATREMDIGGVGEEEREKLRKTYIRQLQTVAGFLEDLGCTISTLVLDASGDLCALGSSEGQKFFSSNPEVVLKFRQHFALESIGEEKCDAFKALQTLFNSKYSEAVGKPSRVPYSKGGFTVTGLPDGMLFRKPTAYGSKQVKKILACKEQIKFHLISQQEEEGPTSAQHGQEHDSDLHRINPSHILQVLSKVVDMEVAKSAMKEQTLIEEKYLEILNLSLCYDDILVLLGQGRPYFDVDAWASLGENMKVLLSQDSDKGVVVPCFNQSDEPYWLFYIPDKVSCLAKITPNKRLNGYWLDKEDVGYSLLYENKCLITGKNIIKCDNGIPLFMKAELPITENVTLAVPNLFHDTVMKCLNITDFEI